MSRSLLQLNDAAQRLFGEWLRLCSAKGVAVCVYCTYRSEAEQARLYRIGRDSHGQRIPGQRVVTYARPGQSKHQLRIALDAAPYDEDQRDSWPFKLDWTPFESADAETVFKASGDLGQLDREWRVMVTAAEGLNIEWGGRWSRFRDYAHFQIPEG